jgi:Nuclease-related domain
MRSEQEIFDELAALCASSGYVHAIAYLCHRDNMIGYSGEMKPEDMRHLFSRSRLIRTEISTLIGLMLKQPIDYDLPAPGVVEQYINDTEALLEEIHRAMLAVIWQRLAPTKAADKDFNPFANGAALRESIFYGAESAYSFQYRDFSPKKYGRDDQWLVSKKGFSILDARNLVHAISTLQDERAVTTLNTMRGVSRDKWTLLPSHAFSASEVASRAGLVLEVAERILDAFVVPTGSRNEGFAALSDFNIANASPLIRTPNGNYLLFHIYSLVEALYESPFYWMGADKSYVNTAMQNRGLFTEQFAVERLSKVFGSSNVFSNVDIVEAKGQKLGEIDVLVTFGNRALILQAKSKRLTLEARRGNDLQIKDDFKKSIQDSSDQAYRCAALLEEGKHSFRDATGKEIRLPSSLKRIYVLCLIADHYPALSFQARQFLTAAPSPITSPPFVMDVFALDAMTEMLSSPLHLLSYIDRRTVYSGKLVASHELTILSYHLKQNLWLNQGHDLVILEDDISTDLDLAMLVRREGIPGRDTPDGILTRFGRTTLGRMVKAIEARAEPATIDLGFALLTLAEDTVVAISEKIDKISERAISDGKTHDFTAGVSEGSTGLTVHCNEDPAEIAGVRLESHCLARKYTQRAQTWFGVCIRPRDQSLRFGLNLDFAWEQSDEMDALTKGMGKVVDLSRLKSSLSSRPDARVLVKDGERAAKKKRRDKMRAASQKRNRKRK